MRCDHRLAFDSFGLVGEVVSDDAALFSAVEAALPPGWKPTRAKPTVTFGLLRDGAVVLDGSEVHREDERRAQLLRLASVIRHRVAETSPSHVFIHAGVVRIHGCGVLIPGSTHSGKTTLVAELVRHGAQYYSDEYAVVDPEGLVHPFAKPLSVRRPGGSGFGDLARVGAAQIGTVPIRTGLVLITSFRPEALWWPRPHASGEGAFELLSHTVSARQRPTAALTAVTQVCREARILAGPRGEASETAGALLRMLDGAADGEVGWRRHGEAGGTSRWAGR